MNPATTQQPQMISHPHVMSVNTVMQSPPRNNMEKYKSLMIRLGITEIVLAVICIACDIAVLSLWYDIGQGIWCGSVLLACGIVGTVTRPTYCMYKANMAMSIISALFMCTLFSLSIVYALNASAYDYYYDDYYDYYDWGDIIALQSVMAVVSFAALIVNIVHSAYCCAGVCNTSVPSLMVVPMQHPNGQIVLHSQPMSYPIGGAYHGPYNPVATMPISGVHPLVGATAIVGPTVLSADNHGMSNRVMTMAPFGVQSQSNFAAVSTSEATQPAHNYTPTE